MLAGNRLLSEVRLGCAQTWDDAQVQLPVDCLDSLDGVVLLGRREGPRLLFHITAAALNRSRELVVSRLRECGLWCSLGHTWTAEQWRCVLSVCSGRS